MAAHDDLDSLLSTLPLSSTEENPLNIPYEELAAGLDLCNRSLIGKFQAREEVIIIQSFKSKMISAWESDFSSINLRKNVYQFIFESEDKLTQIIENGPWGFDGIHLVLHKWRDDWESCKFDECEFWVHIVGLPVKYYISSVGKRLSSLFKGCKKVEIREEEVSGKRFFRLRIRVNILEPFRRVILLTSDNGISCVRGLIQYERLPSLCYVCGLCDHTMDVCNSLSKGELAASEELPFGAWLNADRKSSLLDELEVDYEVQQPKVVKLENGNVEDDGSEGQPKNAATNDSENQATKLSKKSQFVWKIERFSQLAQLDAKHIYSDVFVAGGCKWRVLLFPKGINDIDKFLSVCIVADAASLPDGWSRNVHFSLGVVRHGTTKKTLKAETEHLFNRKESNQGFQYFMPLSFLNDHFIVNDTVTIEAEVDVR